MDLNLLLEELQAKIRDKAFFELANKFKESIRTAQGFTKEEKSEFYKRYKHLLDERNAWEENLKKEKEQYIFELGYLLDVIERKVELTEFAEEAKLFDREFRKVKDVQSEAKEKLWERYQSIWQKRKEFLESKRSLSGSVKERYEKEIVDFDFSFGGAPELKPDSKWEKIGEHIRQARENLKNIRKRISDDANLLSPEKRALFSMIDTFRDKIKEAEELTFNNHGARAAELFEQTRKALENASTVQYVRILQEAQTEMRNLWLRKGDKEKYLEKIDELWGALKEKKKQRKQQFENWLEKQREGLEKLRSVKLKAEDGLARIRKNLEDNRTRLPEARTDEHRQRIESWIKEGEEKEADILRSIADIDKKIAEIEHKLKRHNTKAPSSTEEVNNQEDSDNSSISTSAENADVQNVNSHPDDSLTSDESESSTEDTDAKRE